MDTGSMKASDMNRVRLEVSGRKVYLGNPAYMIRSKWAASRAKGTVLELGCDGGGLTYLLRRNRCRVVAGDIDSALVKKARMLLRLESLSDVEFLVLDAHWLPFREGSVDVITLIDVLEHLKNPVKALTEAKRIARKKILIDVPNYGFRTALYPNLLPEHFKEPSHLHRTDKGLLSRWLSLANLERVKLYGSYVPFPIFLIPISYLIESVSNFVGFEPSSLHFQIKCEVTTDETR